MTGTPELTEYTNPDFPKVWQCSKKCPYHDRPSGPHSNPMCPRCEKVEPEALHNAKQEGSP